MEIRGRSAKRTRRVQFLYAEGPLYCTRKVQRFWPLSTNACGYYLSRLQRETVRGRSASRHAAIKSCSHKIVQP